MKIRIEIKIDNAAFEENWRDEVQRILAETLPRMHNDVESLNLRDINGNTVGKIVKLAK